MSNRYYAPDFVAYFLKRFIAILPLWMALSIAGTDDTNNIVENWYKIVKTIFCRPGKFVQIKAKTLAGRLKEYNLTGKKS